MQLCLPGGPQPLKTQQSSSQSSRQFSSKSPAPVNVALKSFSQAHTQTGSAASQPATYTSYAAFATDTSAAFAAGPVSFTERATVLEWQYGSCRSPPLRHPQERSFLPTLKGVAAPKRVIQVRGANPAFSRKSMDRFRICFKCGTQLPDGDWSAPCPASEPDLHRLLRQRDLAGHNTCDRLVSGALLGTQVSGPRCICSSPDPHTRIVVDTECNGASIQDPRGTPEQSEAGALLRPRESVRQVLRQSAADRFQPQGLPHALAGRPTSEHPEREGTCEGIPSSAGPQGNRETAGAG